MQILKNLLHYINVPQGIKVFKRSITLILYFKCFSNTGRNLHTSRNPTQLSNIALNELYTHNLHTYNGFV